MSTDNLSRLDLLLADRATGDLEWEGFRELGILAEQGEPVDDSMDMAAAALMLALVPEPEPMPASLNASLAALAPAIVGTPEPEMPPQRLRVKEEPQAELIKPGFGKVALMGWLTAAACLIFAVWTLNKKPIEQSTPPVPGLDELRTELLASAQDAVNLPWAATEDPSANGASGDVVWSNDKQKGFMRIRGLETNNPTALQYQLWIFDGSRENPVDGGVFDIPAGESEVLVPIDAKLLVDKPTLFAITVEKPGGVVVSKKERIVLVADPAKAG